MSNFFRTLCLMLLFSPMVLAIGRTGNGLIDEDDGFTAMAPMEFRGDQSMGGGNLRLYGPPSSMSFPVAQPTFIELLRVVISHPEFQTLTRMDILQSLGADGWFTLPQFDPCINSFGYRSGTVALGLAIWGQSRGVLIRAEDTDESWQAINVIINSVKLKAGACDWK